MNIPLKVFEQLLTCLVFFFVLVFFLFFYSPFSIAITSLGKERANFSAFRSLIRFALVCFLFLLVSGKGFGL